jgi:hypothetical protein
LNARLTELRLLRIANGHAGKQAKILANDHIDELLTFARYSRYPSRNRIIVLLSVKAGLRAGEIAKRTWGY